MSRTFRSENNLRDGSFKKRYPKEYYYTKKDKQPLVTDEEYDDDVYAFYECWDFEEMELCGNCGEYNPPNFDCYC